MKTHKVSPFSLALLCRILVLCLFISFQCGCLLAPVLESVSKAGVTSNDRRALLAEDIKSFNQAMYWGNLELALKHVAPAFREEITKELLRRKREEKVVENKIDALVFSEDTFSAKVTILTRYFKVPVYVVMDRSETQSWEFSLTSGWQMTGRK